MSQPNDPKRPDAPWINDFHDSWREVHPSHESLKTPPQSSHSRSARPQRIGLSGLDSTLIRLIEASQFFKSKWISLLLSVGVGVWVFWQQADPPAKPPRDTPPPPVAATAPSKPANPPTTQAAPTSATPSQARIAPPPELAASATDEAIAPNEDPASPDGAEFHTDEDFMSPDASLIKRRTPGSLSAESPNPEPDLPKQHAKDQPDPQEVGRNYEEEFKNMVIEAARTHEDTHR